MSSTRSQSQLYTATLNFISLFSVHVSFQCLLLSVATLALSEVSHIYADKYVYAHYTLEYVYIYIYIYI